MLLIFSENIKKVYAVQLFHRNCFSPQLSLLKSHLEQLGIDQTSPHFCNQTTTMPVPLKKMLIIIWFALILQSK